MDYSQSIEFQIDFMMYLKSIKQNNIGLVSFIPTDDNYFIRSNKYYDILSFKILLCEIIYNGISKS